MNKSRVLFFGLMAKVRDVVTEADFEKTILALYRVFLFEVYTIKTGFVTYTPYMSAYLVTQFDIQHPTARDRGPIPDSQCVG